MCRKTCKICLFCMTQCKKYFLCKTYLTVEVKFSAQGNKQLWEFFKKRIWSTPLKTLIVYTYVLAHSNFAKIRNIFRLHISQATAIIFVLLQWRGERRVAV